MRKRCPKCGNDDELVENSPRVLLHALPQLSSPIEVEVPFTCAACGHEVSTTFRFRATGAQDPRPRPRPRAAEGQDGTKRGCAHVLLGLRRQCPELAHALDVCKT